MQQDVAQTVEKTTSGSEDSFALLQYEINRAQNHLAIHGESAAMRERLNRLTALMKVCVSPVEEEVPM